MRNTTSAALLCLSILCGAAACDSEPDDPVDRAVAIARDIQADPANAEQALADHEITIDEFEELVYLIAADPEMSARYEAGLAGDD